MISLLSAIICAMAIRSGTHETADFRLTAVASYGVMISEVEGKEKMIAMKAAVANATLLMAVGLKPNLRNKPILIRYRQGFSFARGFQKRALLFGLYCNHVPLFQIAVYH